MLDTPARRLNFPFRFRHCIHGLLILVKDEAITPIADGMGLDLNALSQRLLQQRLQLRQFRLFS